MSLQPVGRKSCMLGDQHNTRKVVIVLYVLLDLCVTVSRHWWLLKRMFAIDFWKLHHTIENSKLYSDAKKPRLLSFVWMTFFLINLFTLLKTPVNTTLNLLGDPKKPQHNLCFSDAWSFIICFNFVAWPWLIYLISNHRSYASVTTISNFGSTHILKQLFSFV